MMMMISTSTAPPHRSMVRRRRHGAVGQTMSTQRRHYSTNVLLSVVGFFFITILSRSCLVAAQDVILPPQQQQAQLTVVTTTLSRASMTVSGALGTRLLDVLSSQMTPRATLLQRDSPQGKALQWMLQNDKPTVRRLLRTAGNSNNNDKLMQRYALTVLDAAWNRGARKANVDECKWAGVTCFNSNKRVKSIQWNKKDLQGTIPAEIGTLTTLQTLDLAQNKLQGSLQPLYMLGQLQYLYLFDNQFTGTLTATGVGTWKRLKKFYAGNNQLEGNIPLNSFSATLEWLILHKNNLTGSLSSNVSLRKLRYLDLSHNQLTGNIPSTWPGKLASLQTLDLSHNRLSGNIPSNLPNIGGGRLKQLFLNDNQLRGGFPEGWMERKKWFRLPSNKKLTNVDITNNRLSRNIPNNVCNMSVLHWGELIEFRADCNVCKCPKKRGLCDNCGGVNRARFT